jgi:hypothetical protein
MLLAGAQQGNSTVISVGIGSGNETIQAGINAASNGDTVVVAPGTYYENINFLGKAITVTSTNSHDRRVIDSTIIDGGSSGSVVAFVNSESPSSVLTGFTVTHGSWHIGGGARIYHSSPTIVNNVFRENWAGTGGAIWSGIDWRFYSQPVIVSNLIFDNHAEASPAIYFYKSQGLLASNTIVHNTSVNPPTVYANAQIQAYNSDLAVVNNIVAFGSGGILKYGYEGGGYLGLSNNCVFGNTSFDYSGFQDVTLEPGPGDISVDPQFVDPVNDDFHLKPTSPCIDAGLTGAWTPTLDFDGNPRVLNGVIDIGAYEVVPEPATLIVWSILGASGVTLGWWRRRKQVG